MTSSVNSKDIHATSHSSCTPPQLHARNMRANKCLIVPNAVVRVILHGLGAISTAGLCTPIVHDFPVYVLRIQLG